ncbi:recombinase family protein [Sphingobacterium sp. DR205]|uniref:recombinase family protein n=1 Tax=Sphingobacterium sp. DR205 TaxID=2713573 RepID=UPI0013E48898|nr:recombinase family protein [Sphingobacterium sp. DR205]QIH33527.1 recombinase family protein [Sphingobacterium sp. DR205]
MEKLSIFFKSFAKGTKKGNFRNSKNCVIYTRVSSKDQEKNLSLDTQLKYCNNYAEQHGLTVLANFGGTYESAMTDERREFSAMISFVKKSKEKVSSILVASLERFSRNDNSIWLSSELRKLGIEIISVTQPIDTSNPSGQMQQKMLFLFGEFDNQLRKQKCRDGIKEMLLKGEWPSKPALGFDIIGKKKERRIIVNAKGKLIRQAFLWKANHGLTSEAIRERLAEKGLRISHQMLSKIFHNPFYCGLIVHNSLEGQIVEGKHEKMISQEVFLKVNGLLSQNAHGYTVNEENEHIPLKRFVLCEKCNQPLRGYLVKKKGLYYYKCNTKHCCVNKSARDLNTQFESILSHFSLYPQSEMMELLKEQMTATFNQLTKESQEDYYLLEKEYKTLKDKIYRLEERFIEEEIDKELYQKFNAKYKVEKSELEAKLEKASNKVSNLDECIQAAIDFAVNMPSTWASSDYVTKQSIQNLIFPEGLYYSKNSDKCRTKRINFVFLYLAYSQQVITKKKRGIPELDLDYSSFATLVPRAGIEPALP